MDECKVNFPEHFTTNLYYSLQTAIELIDYVTSYCTENKNVDAIDLREVLEEIMDQEFETICEDESTQGMWLIRDTVKGFD